MNGRRNLLLIMLALTPSILACSSEPSQSTVKGTVTLDGQPLANGLINFVAIDADAPTAEAAITAGQYEAVVTSGEKRVEIRAAKVTGKQKMYDTPDSPMVDVVTELLPARYNVESELRMTVADGVNEKLFELKSK